MSEPEPQPKYEYLGRRGHGTIVGRTDESPWNVAATHRTQILRMLPAQDNTRRGTLCVFGIGDGSAIDFHSLLSRFHEIHVVDRDDQMTRQAIRDQDLDDRHRIFQNEMDVSGVHEMLEQYRAQPRDELFAEICDKIENHSLPELGQFDVVLSNSQIPELTRHAAYCIPQDAEKLLTVVSQIRARHIEMLIQHTAPGGLVMLVVDVVSSKTLPVLAKSPKDVNQLLSHALLQENFFPGAHPTSIDRILGEQGDRFERVDATLPWIRETCEEHFVCLAFRARLAKIG